jgi:alanyl-tRNA synthetase/REP element-mobilizing transposase RayT
MTSSEIRQSFLDFFREKKHTIVPSSSLLPDAPNLLFTNAGMNQFVPIFLGQERPAFSPPRAADTQKCIRAGGKHNDLDDVGLDTYHHTFFEMLGNWSFGDYFKKEAIEWAWELVVRRWKFPAERLYATVYRPGPNEPAEFDTEAHEHWARLFSSAGLNPVIHVVDGNKADNFWMMGETGPCGPCSELHVDLTPEGDTNGSLVNANPDGTFSPLPARHVDTGMGFERVTAIIQGTKDLTDFTGTISNYETDVFRPIFDEIEKLSGKKYGSTLPAPGRVGVSPAGEGVPPEGTLEHKEKTGPQDASLGGQDAHPTRDQIATDIAFRVIADHIRTLSFAIADGIQPSNDGRGYVLRRILRRAVRYGRSLGFHEPFFYQLVDVLALTMGDVFPELRESQARIREVLEREEKSFNKTLDKGIELFEREIGRLSGRVGVSPAGSGILPEQSFASTQEIVQQDTSLGGQGAHSTRETVGATYLRRRRLPHFEQPWAIYALTISTANGRKLLPESRTIVLEALRHFDDSRYTLIATCVMPDHVHAILQPLVKEQNEKGETVFWSLGELLHSIKSFTAKQINKAEGTTGAVWEQERFDRYVRGDQDLEEKFRYIVNNPERAGLGEEYPWIWTREDRFGKMPKPAGETPTLPETGGTPTREISAEFAFRLYDEQGFPLDLTQLMARERGLTVDTDGFERLMEEQRTRARKAQKKSVIEVSSTEQQSATNFLGYEHDHTGADVEAVLEVGGKKGVVLNNSVLYAEMGGQVADSGEMIGETGSWKIQDTRKSGDTWIHLVAEKDTPKIGEHVTVRLDRTRRSAIERHHTVTHLLHWALHEVVSHDAVQKGSYVGPEKLTFDFSSAALTKSQVQEVEKMVNEKIAEEAAVSWTEIPYAAAKERTDIMQFFGDKYGELVRVVQIGGSPNELDGYSMELCGGTHVRSTSDIGYFRILSEGAIAAGIRRIVAVAGNAVGEWVRATASEQDEKFKALLKKKPDLPQLLEVDADRIATMVASIDKRAAQLETAEEQVRAWEKEHAKKAGSELQKRAAAIARELLDAQRDQTAVVTEIQNAGGALLQAVADAMKTEFKGPIFLVGKTDTRVDLVAAVPSSLTNKFQAGALIQKIAPIVGGKGGGRPENARGAGNDASRISEALECARGLLKS